MTTHITKTWFDGDKAVTQEIAESEIYKQEPVAWMSNKDFEPIRIRIMQEAYELADSNDPEGYNAIKVMCGDVQKMLSPQRTWVGLTDEDEIDWEEGGNLKDLVKAIEAKLKQKNGYAEERNI